MTDLNKLTCQTYSLYKIQISPQINNNFFLDHSLMQPILQSFVYKNSAIFVH